MRGRVLLQDVRSGRYFGEKGEWTLNCQQSKLFEHTYQAMLEGLEHSGVLQVVWCFRNPSRNFYVLVREDEHFDVLPCVRCPLSAAPGRPLLDVKVPGVKAA